uniref:26S proteasome regulatory subunit Rpn6 N-terminal domain-containing protein n=1 Tax=Chenopodium quinoa TaxID=63459 RepID=A0A803L5R6_CHEQI
MTTHLPAIANSLALALKAKSVEESISILQRVLGDLSSSPDNLSIKEQAITKLTEFLTQENKAENLLTQLRPYFTLIPKAKTAKIVRGIIDVVAKVPGTTELQISLCREMVQWTHVEKRTFLRQRVEARLAALLMETKEYTEALSLLSNLIKGDLQSGILHAEKDYKTAYGYFYEAFEAFNALEDPREVYSLKYMLLCNVMVNQADDVAGIISSKAGLQYLGPDLDAMKAIADAYSKHSLKLFEASLENFKAQLGEDPIIHRHSSSLYELIELHVNHVESKLSQVILDKRFAGTLDQGVGCLIIFNDPKLMLSMKQH